MPAGPIGSSWASGSWPDTAWEQFSWADRTPFVYTDIEAVNLLVFGLAPTALTEYGLRASGVPAPLSDPHLVSYGILAGMLPRSVSCQLQPRPAVSAQFRAFGLAVSGLSSGGLAVEGLT